MKSLWKEAPVSDLIGRFGPTVLGTKVRPEPKKANFQKRRVSAVSGRVLNASFLSSTNPIFPHFSLALPSPEIGAVSLNF